MPTSNFYDYKCLEFITKSDIHIVPCNYNLNLIQIASKPIIKIGSILPHWHIAPTQGETLTFKYLRDLNAKFKVVNIQQFNGRTKIMFNEGQCIDIYQTCFGLPSRLHFSIYEIETHYSRSLKRMNRITDF